MDAELSVCGLAGAWVGEEVELAFGGVAAKTIKAPLTEQALTGVSWDQKALSAALQKLQQDVNITADAPGGDTLSWFLCPGPSSQTWDIRKSDRFLPAETARRCSKPSRGCVQQAFH